MSSLIITENYLKESSVLNGNVDMKIITPTILLCQDKYIKPLLGEDLFDEILGQIQTSTTTALNEYILDNYVLSALVYYTMTELTPAMKYKYANIGIVSNNDSNAVAADLDEIKFLMDQWRNNAEMYAERCTLYLRDNTTDYPLYIANTDCYKTKANKTNYSTGLFIDDNSDCCEGFYS